MATNSTPAGEQRQFPRRNVSTFWLGLAPTPPAGGWRPCIRQAQADQRAGWLSTGFQQGALLPRECLGLLQSLLATKAPGDRSPAAEGIPIDEALAAGQTTSKEPVSKIPSGLWGMMRTGSAISPCGAASPCPTRQAADGDLAPDSNVSTTHCTSRMRLAFVDSSALSAMSTRAWICFKASTSRAATWGTFPWYMGAVHPEPSRQSIVLRG